MSLLWNQGMAVTHHLPLQKAFVNATSLNISTMLVGKVQNMGVSGFFVLF